MILTPERFLQHSQGRTFRDVVEDPALDFAGLLAFFSEERRQLRMEDAEIHHDRPALAGIVRELEALPEISAYLADEHPRRTKRFRQAVGVIVRIIMEERGWQKTGRKGSLGVRARVTRGNADPGVYHNTGGLAFWFLRAERYERPEGMPFQTVRQLCRDLDAPKGKVSQKKRQLGKRREKSSQ